MSQTNFQSEPYDILKLRISTGFDSHKYRSGKQLIIGGVYIPFEYGMEAHSDGDVLIHSLIDALVSGCSEETIGTLFPDSDSRYKGISSLILLKETYQFVKKKIAAILSADFVLILNHPLINSYLLNMKKNIRSSLLLDIGNINIKAKRNELNMLSAENGIISFCTLLLKIK